MGTHGNSKSNNNLKEAFMHTTVSLLLIFLCIVVPVIAGIKYSVVKKSHDDDIYPAVRISSLISIDIIFEIISTTSLIIRSILYDVWDPTIIIGIPLLLNIRHVGRNA